jgi:hypothetical protein
MSQHRDFKPKDDPQGTEGDDDFYGVNARLAPENVEKGYLSDGVNLRMRDRDITPRKGVLKPAWLNPATEVANGIGPVGTLYGCGMFRDPNGQEWALLAADGGVTRCKANNGLSSVILPTGVRVRSTCSFTQAFNKVYLFRGKYLHPLVMAVVDDGFEDLVPLWDAAETYVVSDPVTLLPDEVAYGPFQAISGITSAADIATVVTAAEHGYVTGADVTIRGATPAEYNGRWNITVVDVATFTFQFGGAASPATVAGTVSNMADYWKATKDTVAGESPDTTPGSWTQVWNVLPNADDAVFINNRLLVPTNYTPGATGYNTNSSYGKKDFVVGMDIGDDVHFDWTNFFRINAGSDDEITGLVKYNEDTAIVFKEKSWGVLSRVSGSLENMQLDMHGDGYGMCALRGAVVAGRDVLFASAGRGICSLQQNELGQTRSVDVPFSNDLARVVDRINWKYAEKIRLAWWDDKLFAAVPLGDGVCRTVPPPPASYTVVTGKGGVIVGAEAKYEHLIPGKVYTWVPGPNEINAHVDSYLLVSLGSNRYRALTIEAYITHTSPLVNLEFTGKFYSEVIETNNAVLVYDFRSGEAKEATQRNGSWQGYDEGSALCVKEWFQATYNGEQRLFFIGADGWVNLMEELAGGDQVEESVGGLRIEEITGSFETRGYLLGDQGPKRWKRIEPVISVWDSKFTITALSGSAYGDKVVREDQEFSRVKYLKPVGKRNYDPTNANLDFETEGRGNYSVGLVSGGVALGNGISLGTEQEVVARSAVKPGQGRYMQFRFENTQGRFRVMSWTVSAGEGARRGGIIV